MSETYPVLWQQNGASFGTSVGVWIRIALTHTTFSTLREWPAAQQWVTGGTRRWREIWHPQYNGRGLLCSASTHTHTHTHTQRVQFTLGNTIQVTCTHYLPSHMPFVLLRQTWAQDIYVLPTLLQTFTDEASVTHSKKKNYSHIDSRVWKIREEITGSKKCIKHCKEGQDTLKV